MSSTHTTTRRIGSVLTACGAATVTALLGTPSASAAVTGLTIDLGLVPAASSPYMSNSGIPDGQFSGIGGYDIGTGCGISIAASAIGTVPTGPAVVTWSVDGQTQRSYTWTPSPYSGPSATSAYLDSISTTGLAPGQHTITASMDGVTSQPMTIHIADAPFLSLVSGSAGNGSAFDPEAAETFTQLRCSLPALS